MASCICGRPAAASCLQCRRPVCFQHAAPACPECQGATFDRERYDEEMEELRRNASGRHLYENAIREARAGRCREVEIYLQGTKAKGGLLQLEPTGQTCFLITEGTTVSTPGGGQDVCRPLAVVEDFSMLAWGYLRAFGYERTGLFGKQMRYAASKTKDYPHEAFIVLDVLAADELDDLFETTNAGLDRRLLELAQP